MKRSKSFKSYILIATSLLVMGLYDRSIAQQDPQFTQYMFNPLVLNPAFAGSREVMNLVLVNRNQWVGFDGAPATQTLSINTPLQNQKMGVGLHVINDKIGAYRSTGAVGSYAYRIKTDDKGKLSFGLRAGIYNYRFNWSELEYEDNSDYVNNYNKRNKVVPTFDFGMYYYTNKMYAGICLSHLNKPSYTPKLSSNDTIIPSSKLLTHINATGGYAHMINKKITLRPSTLIQLSGNRFGFADLNMAVLLNQKFWIGVGYRTSKATNFLLEYKLNNFRFGYSFEMTLTQLRTVNKGSHEIFIGWDINRFKQKTMSIRYI